MQPENYLLVLCTCPRDAAAALAEALVDRRLAACVNIVPDITSVYRWQGRRETAPESLLLIKTQKRVYPQLEQMLREIHPYELPEIIAVSLTQGLTAYLDWINGNTGD
ncbi:MAG: divalent-cation tolerance protein CutA [Gammaproteobacteria bacterium]|nr:divalent-cation tolerance protein CutA [Gammaproteobacteria bacterium]